MSYDGEAVSKLIITHQASFAAMIRCARVCVLMMMCREFLPVLVFLLSVLKINNVRYGTKWNKMKM